MRRPPALLTAAAVAGLAAEPFLEPLLPALRRLDVPVLPAGRPPLRLLHLSDLHLLPRHRRRAAWVRRLAATAPDLVVSTGDHLSDVRALDLLTGIARAFAACPGVFVAGNNDYFTPRLPRLAGYLHDGPPQPRRSDLPWGEIAAALGGAGWTDLTGRRLALPGLGLVLTGTDDAHLRRDRYDRSAGPVEGLGIGVTHTPQARVLDAFAADGHALVLAGHTHGGQLRVPGLGPLITNCDLPRDRALGLTQDLRGWLHVSGGLGTSPYAPVRLCCRPEATLLTLTAA